MSELVTFAGLRFENGEHLRAAFEALGWHVQMNGKIRAYKAADMEIVFPMAAINPARHGYDIGMENDGKEWSLRADFDMLRLDTDMAEKFGTNLEKLKQRYNVEWCQDFASTHSGCVTQMETVEDGHIDLEMEVEI